MTRNENETKRTVLFGLARHSNRKNTAAKKIFWKKDKFNMNFDCGVTRKACITEDFSDHPSLGYDREKEKLQLKDSFHISTCNIPAILIIPSITCEQMIVQSSLYIPDVM